MMSARMAVQQSIDIIAQNTMIITVCLAVIGVIVFYVCGVSIKLLYKLWRG